MRTVYAQPGSLQGRLFPRTKYYSQKFLIIICFDGVIVTLLQFFTLPAAK